MSGHSSRLVYDNCYIKADTKQSVDPGNYRLYSGQAEHNKACSAPLGPRNNRPHTSSEVNTVGGLGNRTDVESALSNRDTPTSRCIDPRTLEAKNKKLKKLSLLNNNVLCDKFLQPDDTRLSLPLEKFRGLTTDLYFDYPLIDPKEWVFDGHNEIVSNIPNCYKSRINKSCKKDESINSRFGINTRLQAKDDYRYNISLNTSDTDYMNEYDDSNDRVRPEEVEGTNKTKYGLCK